MIGHTKVSGPLAVLADGFRTELDRLGYTVSSREFKLAEVARRSRRVLYAASAPA